MIDVKMVFIILLIHWVADFICQSDEVAKNKSKSNKYLLKHIGIYTLVLFAVWPLALTYSLKDLMPWIIFNGLAHLAIDYFTSRMSSKLYAKGDVHNFFVVIGFDQFAHTFLLLSSWIWLVNA